jgi:transcriptional regulator GlxA family with amidase domain
MKVVDRWNVGILVFPDVEVLDFAGPYEVFSRTRLVPGLESRRSEDSAPFRVFTVWKTCEPLCATGGLQLTPDYPFDDAPPIDLLVVPGGFGTRPILEDEATLDWIRRTSARARRTASVCTGSLVLAKAGLLSGRRATTHWSAYDRLASLAPDATVERDVRWVEDGILTSAGVAAGLDLAFHVVETLCGPDVADETARYIEYPRRARG